MKKKKKENRKKKSVPKRSKKSTEKLRDRKPAAREIRDLPRFRALLALRKLSNVIQSDVMADGQVSEKYSISTHRPASLGPNITLHQDQLLAAFREVAAGNHPRELKDDKGATIEAEINIQKDGTATVKIGEATFSFTYAGLLSPNRAERLEYLERYRRGHTLATVHGEALRELVSKQAFSDDDFLSAIEALLTAQESFVQTVQAAVKTRDLVSGDLLPSDVRYWDNLIAPPGGSNTLQEFLAGECAVQRSFLLGGNPVQALYAMSLSFCAPGLVPVQELQELSREALLKALERMASLPDHFGLAGAFEICASLDMNEEVEAVGVKLLDALMDMDRLQKRCKFYAAAFVMAVARLAEHSTLGKRPAFWRRITAAAHASLVLRSCGSDDAESVFDWSMQHFGKAFLLSVLLEMDQEPRWKPDWLTPKHLVADVVGRVDHALRQIPEMQRPKAWTETVAKGKEWIAAQHAELFSILPAIGESARRAMPSEDATYGFNPTYQRFVNEPTAQTLMACGAGIFTVGVTDEVRQACHVLIERLQKDGLRWNEDNTQHVIQILSFVAAQTQDTKLGDLIGEFCIEKARELPDDGGALEIVCRLVECTAADPGRDQSIKTLARRLESVAFLAESQTLFDLADSIQTIQVLAPGLAPDFSKALAAARLGQKAA